MNAFRIIDPTLGLTETRSREYMADDAEAALEAYLDRRDPADGYPQGDERSPFSATASASPSR